jgi:hypothetical protein
MMSKRDVVAEALFQMLGGLRGTLPNQQDWAYFSRNFRPIDNLTDGDHPSCQMIYLGETQKQIEAYGLRTYWQEFLAQITFKTAPGDSLEGEKIGMAMLDTLDTYFPAPVGGFVMPGSAQTLNGKVVQVAIDGKVLLDTGIIDQLMVLFLPISVLAGQ